MSAYKRLVFSALTWGLLPAKLLAQPASYAEAGYLRLPLHREGVYRSAMLKGFSAAVSGLEISLYTAQFSQKEFPDSAALKLNGGFWHIGYIWRSEPTEKNKRLHYTIGFGAGQMGLGGSNGLQVNLHPGFQVNLTRSISLAGSVYTGYTFFGKDRREGGILYENDYYKAFRGFFFAPAVSFRLNTNPMAVRGEGYNRTQYWGGGMVRHESTSREGDYIVTRKSSYYLPAGEYITDAIVTSNNIINIFPKFLVASRKNDRGQSIAGGGGFAFRYGLFAIDGEYLAGRIGFRDYVNHTGNNQDYWKMRRLSTGLGINFFNIPFPFKGSSIIRAIFGARISMLSLESNRLPPAYLPAGASANPENWTRHKSFSPFWAIEFGTLGLQFDFFNNQDVGYGSGLLMSVTYLIPLNNKN